MLVESLYGGNLFFVLFVCLPAESGKAENPFRSWRMAKEGKSAEVKEAGTHQQFSSESIFTALPLQDTFFPPSWMEVMLLFHIATCTLLSRI